ncbi:MAG: hypothetical protein GY792_37885 [Gammaproteobacteria bacterium]|nr:hypothetical protein [Gammaproteobacteria bacterium]
METVAPKLLDLATVLVDAATQYKIDIEQLYITAIVDVITCWPENGLRWPMVVINLTQDPPAGTVVEGLPLGVPFSDQIATDVKDHLRTLTQDDTPIGQIISEGIARCVDALDSNDAPDPRGELLTLLRLFDYAHDLSAHRSLAAAAEVDRAAVVVLIVGQDRWDLAVCDGAGELERQSVVC